MNQITRDDRLKNQLEMRLDTSIPPSKPVVMFTGVSSPDFDVKIVKEGSIKVAVAVSSENLGIVGDKYGESLTVDSDGYYRIVLDMEVLSINGTGSLRIHVSGRRETFSFLHYRECGKQHTSTILKLQKGETVTIRQTDKIETTVAAGSIMLGMYKVNPLVV